MGGRPPFFARVVEHLHGLSAAPSEQDSFHLIHRHLIIAPIIQGSRPRRFVRCHLLRDFPPTAVLQVLRDSCGPERVIPNLRSNAGGQGPPPNHPKYIGLRDRIPCGRFGSPRHGPEQVALGLIGESGGRDVLVEIGFEIVVAGHLMTLAAFLVQSDPAASALGVVVLDPHLRDGPDAPKRVDHGRNQSPIAEPHDRGRVNRIDQLPGFLAREHGRFAFLDGVFGSSDRCGRVRRHDLADDQPVKQHPDGCEVLLDGGLR